MVHPVIAGHGPTLFAGLRERMTLELVDRQAALPAAELARLAGSSEERRTWQRDCNLRTLLRNAAEAD